MSARNYMHTVPWKGIDFFSITIHASFSTESGTIQYTSFFIPNYPTLTIQPRTIEGDNFVLTISDQFTIICNLKCNVHKTTNNNIALLKTSEIV
jgi:hypothetical protein